MKKLVRVLVFAAVALTLSSCTDDPEETMKSQEEVATAARAEVDALAARLGTNPVVKQDVLTDCVPGNNDSGKELIYTLHIEVEPGALDRLKGEIAHEYEANGWTVRQDSDGASFDKDETSIGSIADNNDTVASVFGSGACVE